MTQLVLVETNILAAAVSKYPRSSFGQLAVSVAAEKQR
jgi:hypothetical protein